MQALILQSIEYRKQFDDFGACAKCNKNHKRIGLYPFSISYWITRRKSSDRSLAQLIATPSTPLSGLTDPHNDLSFSGWGGHAVLIPCRWSMAQK
jgi:hypothetical protein